MRLTLETKSVRIFAQPSGHLAVELEPIGEDGWPKDLPSENIYTIPELTKRLGVSRRTIYSYFRRHHNPLPHSKAGGRPRVTESDLMSWLSREKTKAKIVSIV
jgi:excisionase family DNA binding protein